MKKILAFTLAICMMFAIGAAASAVIPSSLQGGGIGALDNPITQTKKLITTFVNGNNFGMWPDGSKTYFVAEESMDTGSGAVMVKSGGTFTSNASDNVWNTWTDAITGSISADSGYYLSLWIKPSIDTSLMNGDAVPFITITSTNDNADTTGLAYWFKNNYVLTANEWNNVQLPLTLGNIANFVNVAQNGTAIDLSALRFLRIWNNNTADLLIDNLSIEKGNPVSDADWSIDMPEGTIALFDNCDTQKGMVFHNDAVGTGYAGYGLTGFMNGYSTDASGSYFARSNGGITLQQIFAGSYPALTLANSRKQYLTFDLYLSDVSLVAVNTETGPWYGKIAAQMSYSAGGGWNDDGMNWLIDPANLTSGWNRIVLPFNYSAEASVDLGYATVTRNGNGPVDENGDLALNQFRIAFTTADSAQLSINVDNVRVVYTEGVPPAALESSATASAIGSESMTLSWTKAADTAGGAVGGYLVAREVYDVFMEEWVPDGESLAVEGADTLTAVVSGLVPETEYRFTVKAVESVEDSPLNVLAVYAVSNVYATIAVPVASPTTAPTAAPTAVPTSEPTDESPATGDPIAATTLLLAISAGAAILLKKKR